MEKIKISGDLWLVGAVAAVWAVLAALYEFVPALRMPGSSLLWGSGALVFLGIAGAIVWVENKTIVELPNASGLNEKPDGSGTAGS